MGGGGSLLPKLFRKRHYLCFYMRKETLQLSPYIEYLKDILPLTPIMRFEK